MQLSVLRTVFLVIFSYSFTLSFAQDATSEKTAYNIQRLKNLPQNDVNYIFKDSKGFLWFGTLDGLHRYDGYEYKTYRIETGKNSISSNLILVIDEDQLGNIWIGTYDKGICKLNPITEQFTIYNATKSPQAENISNDLSCMLVDNNNVIWIGNWFGITRITFDEKVENIVSIDKFTIEPVDQKGAQGQIKEIHQDKKGNIWVGTNQRVVRLINPYGDTKNIKTDSFAVNVHDICDYEDGILIGGHSVFAIRPEGENYTSKELFSRYTNAILYQNGTIWIGGREGVFAYTHKKSLGWELDKHFSKNFTKESLGSNIVTAIASDDLGQVWAGMRSGGASVIRQHLRRFNHFQHTRRKGSLSSDLTRCIFEDSRQNLWVGTEDGGVNILPKEQEDNYTTGFKDIRANNSDYPNLVYAIAETHHKDKSTIWLGTGFPTNLVAIDPLTLEKKTLPQFTDSIHFVFALLAENNHTLWAGTYGNGLWRISLDENGIPNGYTVFTPQKDDPNSISSVIIRSIFMDSKRNLWIGTDKGLNRLSSQERIKKKPKFEVFRAGKDKNHPDHDYILQIIETRDGRIWTGTMGAGMIVFEEKDGKKGTFRSISTQDGLPNNTVKSIVEGELGYLWLATNNGLSRFNPTNGDVINYDAEDGLMGNEFSEICATRRKNGEMVFGGLHGLNIFQPKAMVKDKNEPKLFFTDFFILNKKVHAEEQVDGNTILQKSIEHTKDIELEYSQNSFSIAFVSLHLNAPQKNKYKYKLEGFDKQWFNASSDYRMAKYTNIPDGKYVFKVRGSNCDNIWAEQTIELKIKVYPPLYRSKAAFIFYIALWIALFYISYRFFNEMAFRKKQLLVSNMEKQNIEEMAHMKLRFFTNISHEFRTPLTLIKAPLEKLMSITDAKHSEERHKNQLMIQQNVNVMMRLVNQLLDFRSMEQDKQKINPSKQNLSSFVLSIHKLFAPMAEKKQINYLFHSASDELFVWFDPEKIEKVIYNLLSNAFKFTPKKGSISVELKHAPTKNEVIISVKDSGIGISEEDSKMIFERYFQASRKEQINSGGTGIGLSLAQSLVELHGGTISCTSELNEGSTFSVSLPIGEKLWPEQESEDLGSQLDLLHPTVTVIPEKDNNAPSAEGVTKRKILLVEDNIELRLFLADIFGNDFEVFQADDGKEGLLQCNEQQPDIVVSDVMMPNIDGIEMCQKIKTDEAISHIPVVLLTAKDTTESHVEGLETGADAYLSKPFNTDILKATVMSVIKNREQLRDKFQKEIKINPSIISNTSPDSKFLDKILAIIEDNLSDSEFTIEKLAETYGVSRVYLNRKIKALTGETSNQFMRNIRLKHAAELLKQNQWTVSEVTWKVGYNDLRTFRQRFKDMFGVSPSEFAKQHQA